MTDLMQYIREQIQSGMNKFGTIRRDCTYNQMGVQTYDPDTGIADEPVLYSQDLKVVFSQFMFSGERSANQYNNEADFISIDRYLIISNLDLLVVPSVQDVIIDDQGVSWRIMGVQGDPADAHWSLHGRPTNE